MKTSLFIALFLVGITGCIHSKQVPVGESEYNKGFYDGQLKARKDFEMMENIYAENEKTLKENFYALEKENAYKTHLLEKHNLISKDGKLDKYPERRPEKPINCNKPWMK